MRLKAFLIFAVAASFVSSAGAFAGGKHHQRSAEVQTPSSVSEAGPSVPEALATRSTSGMNASARVTHDSKMSSNAEYWRMDEQPSSVGASSSMGASGSIRFDSSNPGLE
jgi:hypothetical protein